MTDPFKAANDNDWAMQRALKLSGFDKHWTIEELAMHATTNGVRHEVTINVMMHVKRGIAFGNSEPLGAATPDGNYLTDIIHVPSRARMFAVGGGLMQAASLALLVARSADWETIASPMHHLQNDVMLSQAYLSLMNRDFAFVIAGGEDEQRLYKYARAAAQAANNPAGNA